MRWVMTKNRHTLRFRAVNRNIFDAIRSGKKKIETRAGSPKFFNIEVGDMLVFICGKDRFEKKVKKAKKFKDIKSLLKVYKPQDINPKTRNLKEFSILLINMNT